MQVLEVLPSGESGYRMTKTLKELLQYVQETISKIESSNTSPMRNIHVNTQTGYSRSNEANQG